MSSTLSNKSKRTLVVKAARAPTPYCATCHKAGKPVSVYTGHFTKSSPGPDGVVVCPLILSTVCKSCRKTGHWTKYCPDLACQSEDDNSVNSNMSKSDLLKKAIHWGEEPSKIVDVATDSNPAIKSFAFAVKFGKQITEHGASPSKRDGSVGERPTSGTSVKEVEIISTPSKPICITPGAPVKSFDNIVAVAYFNPVTPDSTPPQLRRRLWADMDEDDDE